MRLTISPGKFATLACAYKIQMNAMPQKYVSICSDSQVALKVLYAAKTRSPLVRQCQQVLDDISAWHAVGLCWVPGHVGVRGNEITDELTRSSSAQRFVAPEPFLGVSRQNIRRKLKCWMVKQHLALCHGICNMQR